MLILRDWTENGPRLDRRKSERAVILGAQLTSETPVYKTDHKSPLYTTDMRDIITVKAK